MVVDVVFERDSAKCYAAHMIPWRPISELPASLKDGREVLLWDGQSADVGTWSEKGAHFGEGEPGWSETAEGSELEGVTHYAEINAPVW